VPAAGLAGVTEAARAAADLAERAGGAEAATRAAAVLAWGARHLRDLPWRATRDPWAILVSEVMAQQTGVDRVIPYWHGFLARFPTPAACAAAPVGDVVRLWSGLGYNRRAVNLHRCAGTVVERHGGTLPDDLDALLALPGVGPYTARAVLAFAFERPVGVVDTNVGRVLARWEHRSLRPAAAQALADTLARTAQHTGAEHGVGPAWMWNQAVMELGGTVCRRRRPDCRACPVRRWCAWATAGLSPPDPADGSAGVSTGQPRFQGSDRQGRGRLVEALCRGPVAVADAATVMGWPDDPARADRVVVGMLAEGLAAIDGDTLRLP
jgi:A/G-specific adenine glycosylase